VYGLDIAMGASMFASSESKTLLICMTVITLVDHYDESQARIVLSNVGATGR